MNCDRHIFISSSPNNAETSLTSPKQWLSSTAVIILKKKKAAITKEKKKKKVPQVPSAEASHHHQFISTCVPRKTKTAYAANMSQTWNALVTKAKSYATCPLCRRYKKKKKVQEDERKGSPSKSWVFSKEPEDGARVQQRTSVAFGHKSFVKKRVRFETQGHPPDASDPGYSWLGNMFVCVCVW